MSFNFRSLFDRVNTPRDYYEKARVWIPYISVYEAFDEPNFIEFYLGLMRYYRLFHDKEYIRAYLYEYIARYLATYMYSIWVTYDDAKQYGKKLISKIMEFAERKFIEIEEVRKTVIDTCNETKRLIDTGELLKYINPENSSSIRSAKQNIIIRKCKKCRREFISLTDKAVLYLLENYYVLIPREWLEYCPKCKSKDRLLGLYIEKHYERIREYKKYNYKYYLKRKEKILKKGRRIYSDLYQKYHKMLENQELFQIKDLINVLKASEYHEKEYISNWEKRANKFASLFKELMHNGPLTLNELVKLLAQKLGLREPTIKKWIEKEILSRDINEEIVYVIEQYGKTIEVDISPLFVLRAIIYLLPGGYWLEVEEFRYPDLYDIYVYIQRHDRECLIPVINTIFELRRDWFGIANERLFEYPFHPGYRMFMEQNLEKYLERKDMDPSILRWKILEDTIREILGDLINKILKNKEHLILEGINGINAKYIILRLKILYERNKEYKEIFNNIIRNIYHDVVKYYNDFRKLKEEIENIIQY